MLRPSVAHALVTIDHNLLIDLEVGNDAIHQAVEQIVTAHDASRLTISVSAIGASERLKGKLYASSFTDFLERVGKLSRRAFEILKLIGYWDIMYYDWCILVDPGTSEANLEERIHKILFPKTACRWHDYAQMNGLDPEHAIRTNSRHWQQWRNKKSDVLSFWSHVHYKGDLFVAADKNFHKATKKPLLEVLGKKVLSPSDFAF